MIEDLDKKDYVITFWASGVSILYTDMVIDMYKRYDPLIYIYDGKYYQYLSKDKFELAGKVGIGLYGSKENFEAYLLKLNKICADFKEYCSNNISKDKPITKEIVESFCNLALDFHLAYSETGFEHTDTVYSVAIKDGNELMKENLEKVGEVKNDVRAVMNSIFFESNSYFDILLNKLSEMFKVDQNNLLNYKQKELVELFDGKVVGEEEIKLRNQGFAAIVKDGEVKYYSGKDVGNIHSALKEELSSNTQSFKGIVASKGKVTGRVKVIPVDYSGNFSAVNKAMEEMEQGQVLVTETTAPELMIACRKASAIITDQGGLMSHAAIVSREFKIPCIIGTKIATQVLKDGDEIEVDANKGIVKILKHA